MDLDFGDVDLRAEIQERSGESSGWAPQIDVSHHADKLVIRADLVGLEQQDVRVTIEDGELVISGERHHEHEDENGVVYRCERRCESFRRAMRLPEGVEPSAVHARFGGGVLEIRMPMPARRDSDGGKGQSSSAA